MLHPKLNALVGVLILCAKPEEKSELITIVSEYYDATDSVLSGYPTFNLPAGDAGVEEVLILADCGQMANVSAASRTGYLAARFAPNLIIFVGSAGSLKPDECEKFDVVVPTLGVETMYYDKIEDAGQLGFFRKAHKPSGVAELGAFTANKYQYSLSPRRKNISLAGHGSGYVATACAANNKGATIKTGLENAPGKETVPKVHIDASIFSWDMVLASGRYRDLLVKQLDRKTTAVDMESFGFLSALEQFSAPPTSKPISGLIVRGISDVCGDKSGSQEEGRNALATRNAARVACHIVRDGYLKD